MALRYLWSTGIVNVADRYEPDRRMLLARDGMSLDDPSNRPERGKQRGDECPRRLAQALPERSQHLAHPMISFPRSQPEVPMNVTDSTRRLACAAAVEWLSEV
jgi:hypothetical protein